MFMEYFIIHFRVELISDMRPHLSIKQLPESLVDIKPVYSLLDRQFTRSLVVLTNYLLLEAAGIYYRELSIFYYRRL